MSTKSFILGSLMASATFGAVISRSSAKKETSTAAPFLWSAKTLGDCENAPNCEVYDSDHGKSIRFKKGMEPGSAWHEENVSKRSEFTDSVSVGGEVVRRDGVTYATGISYGDNTINYGFEKPWDVINNLTTVCTIAPGAALGLCDTNDLTIDIDWVTDDVPTAPTTGTITIKPDGQYQPDTLNYFIGALVYTMKQGIQWQNTKWETVTTFCPSGSCPLPVDNWVNQPIQTSYVGIARVASDGSFGGYMQASLAFTDTSGTGGCGPLTDAAGMAAAALALVPGAEAASAGLGVLSAACGALGK